MGSVQKVCSHVIRKIETFIEEDTRYKKQCTQDNATSVPVKVGTLGPHTVLLIAISCPFIFSWLKDSLKSLPFQWWSLVLGKARSHRTPSLGWKGDCVTRVIWCFTKNLHEMWGTSRRIVKMKQPITSCHSCSLQNHPSSFHGGMFKLKAKLNADLLIYLLILNAVATQYTYSLHSISHPHWLGQWSHRCSRMCIPVHSPWLPACIYVVQTILIMLTMAVLFPERPHILRKLKQEAKETRGWNKRQRWRHHSNTDPTWMRQLPQEFGLQLSSTYLCYEYTSLDWTLMVKQSWSAFRRTDS